MKKILLGLFLLPLTVIGQVEQTDYLRKVLHNLEQVKSASYRSFIESYVPGDTIPATRWQRCREFDNPADTTIGAAYLHFNDEDTTHCIFGYDGRVRVIVDDDERVIIVDDFTISRPPFGPVASPFFSYTESIIRYALTTDDPIEIQLAQDEQDYHFRLVINADKQVEFFGKPYYMPTSSIWDPVSIYEIKMRKADDLPYKIRREMAHDISIETISEVKLNHEPETALRLADYYPANYKITQYGVPGRPKPTFDLTNKKAPDWILPNADGSLMSLSDFKSKVVLINFTGIGCGACYQAIKFLNGLKHRYPLTDFDLVAIETWGKAGHSIQAYTDRNKLEYKTLEGNKDVLAAYTSEKAVPLFMLLDKQRIVRHIFKGYGSTSDASITQAIEALLQE